MNAHQICWNTTGIGRIEVLFVTHERHTESVYSFECVRACAWICVGMYMKFFVSFSCNINADWICNWIFITYTVCDCIGSRVNDLIRYIRWNCYTAAAATYTNAIVYLVRFCILRLLHAGSFAISARRSSEKMKFASILFANVFVYVHTPCTECSYYHLCSSLCQCIPYKCYVS